MRAAPPVIPPADLQLIERLYERWSRGDYATPEFFDPEIHYERIGETVPGDSGVWHGVEAMWRSALTYIREWEDLHNVPEQIVEVGERILVLDRQSGRGRRSGASMERPLAQIFTVRGGRIVRWESYWDREEALRRLDLRNDKVVP
jgi:ketosteroid isomerase-like protein